MKCIVCHIEQLKETAQEQKSVRANFQACLAIWRFYTDVQEAMLERLIDIAKPSYQCKHVPVLADSEMERGLLTCPVHTDDPKATQAFSDQVLLLISYMLSHRRLPGVPVEAQFSLEFQKRIRSEKADLDANLQEAKARAIMVVIERQRAEAN